MTFISDGLTKALIRTRRDLRTVRHFLRWPFEVSGRPAITLQIMLQTTQMLDRRFGDDHSVLHQFPGPL